MLACISSCFRYKPQPKRIYNYDEKSFTSLHDLKIYEERYSNFVNQHSSFEEKNDQGNKK